MGLILLILVIVLIFGGGGGYYAHSRYDYMLDVIKLQQAAGTLSEQSLQRLNVLLTDTPPPPPPTDLPPSAKAP